MKLHPALLLLAWSVTPLTESVAQGPPSPVRVGEVRLETVAEKRRVTGDVRAIRRTSVATREPGLVLEITKREGERVEAGEVLAQLDDSRLRLERDVLAAEKSAAEATLAERRRSAEQSTRDLEILRTLSERNAANRKELLDAETADAVAKARVMQAEAE
ncbi:MAG: biotin/lipoyl-binding protein, partial [Planctomycetota bacterium]